MNATDAVNPPAPKWAIVELMGHLRLAGLLSEEEHFGAKMGRIDIPRPLRPRRPGRPRRRVLIHTLLEIHRGV